MGGSLDTRLRVCGCACEKRGQNIHITTTSPCNLVQAGLDLRRKYFWSISSGDAPKRCEVGRSQGPEGLLFAGLHPATLCGTMETGYVLLSFVLWAGMAGWSSVHCAGAHGRRLLHELLGTTCLRRICDDSQEQLQSYRVENHPRKRVLQRFLQCNLGLQQKFCHA
jgi:hypothetical protein